MVNTPPADRRPILTYVGEYEEPAAISEAIRRELLREGQVFYVHNRVPGHRRRSPARSAAWSPRPGWRWRTARWTRARLETGGARLLGAALRRAGVHHHHRVGHRHALGQHPDRGPGRPARAWASSTSCGAGWAGPASGPTPTCSTRPTGSSPSRPTSGCGPSASTPSWARGSRSPSATCEIRGAGNLLGPDQSGHIAAVGYDLYVQMVAEAVAEPEGRAPAAAGRPSRSTCPTTPTCRQRLRGGRGRPPRGLPPPDRGRGPTSRSTTSRTEWEDRFGPLPGPAAALLDVARLRVECLRLGVTDVAVTVPRRRGMGRSTDRASGEAVPGHAAGLGRGQAAPAGPRGHLPGRPAPAAPGRPGAHGGRRVRCGPGGPARRAGTGRGRRPAPVSGPTADSIAAVKRQLPAAVVALVVGRLRRSLASACDVTPPAASANGSTISTASLNTQLQTLQTTAAGGCLLQLENAQLAATDGRGGRRAGDLLDDVRQRRARATRSGDLLDRAARRLEGHRRHPGRRGRRPVRVRIGAERGDQSADPAGPQAGTSSLLPDATAASAHRQGAPGRAAGVDQGRTRSGTRPSTRSSGPTGPTCPMPPLPPTTTPTWPSSPRRA